MGLPSSTAVLSGATGRLLLSGRSRRVVAAPRAGLAALTLFLASPLTTLPAHSAAPCPEHYRSLGRIASVTGAGELVLEDGRLVRLAAIDAAGGETILAAALRQSTPGRTATLASATEGTDRYGRLAGLVRIEAGNGQAAGLLQDEMLTRGLALARPEAGFLGCMPGLISAEHPARLARRGLWAQLPVPAYDLAALKARRGRFTILAGRVLTVGTGRTVDYLNFGKVWRKDATVRLEKDVSHALTQRGIAPAMIAGQQIVVRGPLIEEDGPAMDVRWIEQIAALDEVWEGQEAGDR